MIGSPINFDTHRGRRCWTPCVWKHRDRSRTYTCACKKVFVWTDSGYGPEWQWRGDAVTIGWVSE